MDESKMQRFPIIFILLFLSLFIIFFFIAPTKNDKKIHQKEFELTVEPVIPKHNVSCWRFGSVNLKEKPLPSSNILTINSSRWGTLDAALLSLDYVAKVGGVAFESIANPSQELKDKNIFISYNSENPDGKRLMIKIGDNSYNPELYDWLLIPIAIYANSKSTGCVSLFGPNQDKNSYDVLYHSAFINTLLGIRLLHADIFLMNPFDYSKLPMADSKIIYGKGESNTDESLQLIELFKLFDIISSEKFKSWVFTDNKVNVEFYVESNKFLLTGKPYYYFWDIDPILVKRNQKQIDEYKQKVKNIDNKIENIKNKFTEFANFAELKVQYTIEKLKNLNNLIFTDFNRDIFEKEKKVIHDLYGYKLYGFPDNDVVLYNNYYKEYILRKNKDKFIEQFIPNTELINIVINKLVSHRNNIVEEANSKPLPIIPVESITDNLKKIELCNLNKPVFDAAIKVMRFSAFFRYVKKSYNNSWNNFYKKIATSDRSHFSYTTPIRLDKYTKK